MVFSLVLNIIAYSLRVEWILVKFKKKKKKIKENNKDKGR